MRGNSYSQISIFLPTFWFLGSIVPEILCAAMGLTGSLLISIAIGDVQTVT
jgi:hypothetical protein